MKNNKFKNLPFQLHLGDCIAVMRGMADSSVDSIVTDPPYELTGKSGKGGFMGKAWDASGIAHSVEMWTEAMRVLKPGGHLLAFSSARTQHRMVCAIEDAGFEIRDSIAWMFSTGFPKSLNVSKAIDKRGGNAGLTAEIGAAIKFARIARHMSASECDRLFCGGTTNWSWFEGRPTGQRAPTPETFSLIVASWPELASLAAAVADVEREVTGQDIKARSTSGASALPTVGGQTEYKTWDITASATDAARQWDGWGTALKPSHEPVCVARKPLVGTVAANVLAHGTGAMNIDGCRVGTDDGLNGGRYSDNKIGCDGNSFGAGINLRSGDDYAQPTGRWPANLIHDNSDEVVALFPESNSARANGNPNNPKRGAKHTATSFGQGDDTPTNDYRDTGSAARFFYCAKTSRTDRNEGLTDPGPQFEHGTTLRKIEDAPKTGNTHPTVKPTDLMAYLCRLVTPPGGTVLDPFMGSGSTGKACMREGFQFIGIDMTAEYHPIAEARIAFELERAQEAATAKLIAEMPPAQMSFI